MTRWLLAVAAFVVAYGASAASLHDELARYTDTYARAPAIAVALITADGVEVATAGLTARDGAPVTPRTQFEIGSLTKIFTGLLLAELTANGVTRPSAPLSSLVPEGYELHAGVRGVRLEELVTHTSGLPRVTASATMLARMLWRFSDPYRGTTRDELFRALARIDDADLARRGHFQYSNFGMAVLGRLLEEAAGQPYERLIEERVLTRLGMTETGFEGDPHRLAVGHRSNLRPATGWQLDAYAPAGGLHSTLGDMTVLVQQALEGEPLLRASLEPLWVGAGRRMGMGWIIDDHGGEPLVWHNGRTGGFYAFVGFLPESGRGLVLLSNASHDGNPLALALLNGRPPQPAPPTDQLLWDGFMLLLTALVPFVAFSQRWMVSFAGDGIHGRSRGRVHLVHGATGTFVLLLVTWTLGPWHWAPQLFWWLALLFAVALLGSAVAGSARLPWVVHGGWWRNALPVVGTLLHLAFVAWFGANL
jgi:serine-type D-Ala-D-Ala carboxypeptidase/endopeptidase